MLASKRGQRMRDGVSRFLGSSQLCLLSFQLLFKTIQFHLKFSGLVGTGWIVVGQNRVNRVIVRFDLAHKSVDFAVCRRYVTGGLSSVIFYTFYLTLQFPHILSNGFLRIEIPSLFYP